MSNKSASDHDILEMDAGSPQATWLRPISDRMLWLLLPLILVTTWLLMQHWGAYMLGAIGLGLVALMLRRTTHKLRDAEVRARAVVNHLEASQQKLEAIINSVDGIVWEADAQTFQFTFVSQKAERILGYPVDDWISDPAFWPDHLHADDRNGAVEFCTRATSELRPHEFEYRMLAADGRVVWVNDIVTVICEHGRPTKLRGIIVDITESKRAAATLRESEARLQVAIQASNLGPWDWNLVTNKVHFSPEWKRQLGYADEEIDGHYLEFVNRLHPQDHDRIMSDVQAYIADPLRGYDVEFRMRHKDGSYRWIHTRATMQFDAANKPVRMLGCHLDITERKSRESELEILHKKLLNSSRQAGMAEVATNVLHNVGNVLNSVNVSATLVVDGIKKSKVSGLVRVADLLKQQAGDLGGFMATDGRGKQLPAYLAQLSKHLLAEQDATVNELESLQRNISHIKEIVAMQQNYAKVSGVKEIVNVVDLVEDTLRMNSGALAHHGVEVVREFETVPLINIDKHKVLQILVNLVRNAKIACCDMGTADKRLTLRVVHQAGRIKVSVIDNGVGIPAENLTRIFNHGFTTRESGHGFGLHSGAIAANEMGGSLTARSAGTGQGACFTLELSDQIESGNPMSDAGTLEVTQSTAIRVESANQWPQLLVLFAVSLFTLFFSTPAYALDPNKSILQFNCQNWTRQSGLPAHKISAITQDENGYIWLGTQNGLVRFDGLELKVVPIELPEAHGQNIRMFSRSKAGGMWFAVHEGGFGKYDGHRFAAIDDARWTIAGLEAIVILEARDGAVWTGGNLGLGRWVPGKPDECVFNDSSNGTISALCEDSESRIWIGTVERGLFFWKNGNLTKCPDDTLNQRIIFAVAAEPNGKVWAGTQVDLRCYDSKGQLQQTPSFTGGVNALLVDSHGVLWIGTGGDGLARYQNGLFTYFKKADGLASDHVNSLFEDAEGSLWIGTRDGLSQLSDLKFPIYSSQEGLVTGSNLSVAPSQQGGVWITTSQGICYFDGKTPRNYGLDFPLPNHYVNSGFEARNGDFYAVDGNKNIVVVSGNAISKVYSNPQWPMAFAEDATSILVAIGGELYRIQDGKLNPFQYNAGQVPICFWINNLLIATDGAIWVASNNGLVRIKDGDSKRWSKEDGLSGNKVYSVCEDEEGNIWAGLATGIVRIKNDLPQMIRQQDGLYDDRIYAIVPDDFGAFWIASGRGFFRVEQQSLDDFVNGASTLVSCDAFDGLESVKFADRTDQDFSGCKTLDGRIWFPTPQGVVSIDPAQVRTNTVELPVHIGRVLANGKDVTQNENTVISPGKGELEFHFTGLSFVSPHKIRFRYKLDGYDKDWVEAGERRMGFYTNLKPGNYSFHVIAANADGVWNLTGDSFKIQLLPYFYQTVWFKLLCVAAACAALALFYVRRVRHLHLKQKALEKSRDILDAEVRSRTADLADAIISLERRSKSLEQEVEERKRMQSEVERVHQQLLVASRQAGMAEIATNVLHNVGNVLNSVNISASLVADGMKKSKISNLPRVVAMLNEHASDLATFLTSDVKGKQLINFLGQLSEHLLADRDATIKELDLLRKNIDHIKHIVAMQQNYAKVSGIRDVVNIIDLLEDSLRMNAGSLSRHEIEVVREFEPVPELNLDKHKILQILVNLIRNAKYACDDSLRADKRVTLRVAQAEDRIVISVIDNGIGIPPENLTRIFNHGFTTRQSGHGFGLHSGALAAKEMGGALIANSDGVGHGATFRLELPLSTSESTHEKEPQLQSA